VGLNEVATKKTIAKIVRVVTRGNTFCILPVLLSFFVMFCLRI